MDELPDFDRLWDYNRPEETEARFRELLDRAAADVDYHAQLLTQVARAQGLQRKFEEAQRTLDEAEGLLGDSLPRARARYLLERGRVFNSAGDPGRALPFFLEAWEVARQAREDFHAIDAAHMLGIAEAPEAQLDWNLTALLLAERTPDARAKGWLGSLYNNIGWTYHDRGDYETALAFFERALERREAQEQPEETRIARWCVAKALRSLGRVEAALHLQRGLLAEYEALGERSGYVFEELGECLLSLDRAAQARPFFVLAYEALSQDPWLSEAEPDRIARLKELRNHS